MFPASQKTIQTWASGTRLRAMKQRGSMRNDPWLLGQFGEEEGCQCEMGCLHENAIDKNVWPLIFQYSYMGVSEIGVCPANGYLILN